MMKMKNNKGLTLVEVMVAMLLAAITMTYGTTFFVKAFNLSFTQSDHEYNMELASNVLEQVRRSGYGIIFNPAGTTIATRFPEANNWVPDFGGQNFTYLAPSGARVGFVSGSAINTRINGRTDGNNYAFHPQLVHYYVIVGWPLSTTLATAKTQIETVRAASGYANRLTAMRAVAANVIVLRTYFAKNIYFDFNNNS